MTIGENIKYYRIRMGITQNQLAALAEIHPVSIRKYETNKMQPQIDILKKLAGIFKISLDDLCSDSKPITEQQIIKCAKTLSKNTDNIYLKNVLEELIINGDCFEEDEIYLVVKKICEDGFDITGFRLEEIPHHNVYTFAKEIKELGIYQEFDVYLNYFNGGSDKVTVGYIGNDACTHNAKNIKEAIEKGVYNHGV